MSRAEGTTISSTFWFTPPIKWSGAMRLQKHQTEEEINRSDRNEFSSLWKLFFLLASCSYTLSLLPMHESKNNNPKRRMRCWGVGKFIGKTIIPNVSVYKILSFSISDLLASFIFSLSFFPAAMQAPEQAQKKSSKNEMKTEPLGSVKLRRERRKRQSWWEIKLTVRWEVEYTGAVDGSIWLDIGGTGIVEGSD